ncbi:hypothetical protein ANN_06563 [Periplaneta americana]|uniref:Uncharacterized protein n=1 Tax=Periplaneta americana TaxID=6978 RepID=A0ABQ8TFH5_PERAM|nr:hypothetical protein ANN_06563 [Periplaneta americana]
MQWSGIHSRNKPRWCSCMAKQMKTVERQHGCIEPRTLADSTTHITQHLEPFFSASVSMGPLRQTNVQGGRRLRTPDVEEHVLHDFENNPDTSCRQVARQHGR